VLNTAYIIIGLLAVDTVLEKNLIRYSTDPVVVILCMYRYLSSVFPTFSSSSSPNFFLLAKSLFIFPFIFIQALEKQVNDTLKDIEQYRENAHVFFKPHKASSTAGSSYTTSGVES
jgi:hypothetical protein